MKAGIFNKIIAEKLKNNKNKTIVELYINNEMNLYNNFSVFNNNYNADNVKINNQIIDYIKEETGNIPIKNSLVISVKIPDTKNCNVHFIEKLIKKSIKEKILIINKKIKKMNFHSLILVLVGMALIGITQVFQIMEKRYSLNEFIIVMSWVFMWKSVDLLFFERTELMKERGILMKIYYSEIVM